MATAPKAESRYVGPSHELGEDGQLWELKIPLGVACPYNPTAAEFSDCVAQCERLVTEAEETFQAEHVGSYPSNAEDSFFDLMKADGLASHQSDGQCIFDSATLYMETPASETDRAVQAAAQQEGPVDPTLLPWWAQLAWWASVVGLLSVAVALVWDVVILARAGVLDIRGILWTLLLMPLYTQSEVLAMLEYGGLLICVVATFIVNRGERMVRQADSTINRCP